MTELQPTEVELTGKKRKPISLSKRKILFFGVILLTIALAAVLTAVLAHRASKPSDIIQQQALPTEGTIIENPQ